MIEQLEEQASLPLAASTDNSHTQDGMGWDVFANGRYLAGGLTINPDTELSEPMFSTIAAVRTWVNKQSI